MSPSNFLPLATANLSAIRRSGASLKRTTPVLTSFATSFLRARLSAPDCPASAPLSRASASDSRLPVASAVSLRCCPSRRTRLPAVAGLLRDPVLPAQLRRGQSWLALLQDRDDLLFAVSRAFHLRLSSSAFGRTHIPDWYSFRGLGQSKNILFQRDALLVANLGGKQIPQSEPCFSTVFLVCSVWYMRKVLG